MYEFCYVDSQNLGPEGKKNQLARKRLSDITNTQTHHKSLNHDEKLRPHSFATKEYIEKLQKENVTLRQLLQGSTHVLQERNKLIELTGIELTKMRINFQKLQQQNRLLAQTNIQMTMGFLDLTVIRGIPPHSIQLAQSGNQIVFRWE